MLDEIKCDCGKVLKGVENITGLSQDTDTTFIFYCTNCKTRLTLSDTTEIYEELVINGDTDPQHGEYESEDDLLWYYADGKCME